MADIVIADTERQPAQALDKAVACVLTDRGLGQRATFQQCLVCNRWTSQDNLEFIFTCSLVKGADHQPAVKCQLRTRYPAFTCRDCTPFSQLRSQTAAKQAVVVKEEDQDPDEKQLQLSPDHVGAVYSLCSTNGKANLNGLAKTFTITCPDCGNTVSGLCSPRQVQDHVKRHLNSTRASSSSSSQWCRTLQRRCLRGAYSIPEAYGSNNMLTSPVEDKITQLISRILVAIALHIAKETCTDGRDQQQAATGSGSNSNHLLYLPWRNWAIQSLTQDMRLLAAANYVRPNLASLSLPHEHSLLDLVLAPPFIAAGEKEAGMTAHKLAVLMKCRMKALMQQGRQVSLATAAGVTKLLGDMLTDDAVFKHFPKEQRVLDFLAIAGFSSCGSELATALSAPHVRPSHLKVCVCCGGVNLKSLTGCSFCILSKTCRPCSQQTRAEVQNPNTCAPAATALSTTNTTRMSSAAPQAAAASTAATTAAVPGTNFCPWCEDHDDTAARLTWYQGCLTDQQFDSLRVYAATAAQRSYFVQLLRFKDPWRFEQQLPNGFIVIQIDDKNPTGRNGPFKKCILAPDGKRVKNKQEMDDWLHKHAPAPAAPPSAAPPPAAAAVASGPSSSNTTSGGVGVSTGVPPRAAVAATAAKQVTATGAVAGAPAPAGAATPNHRPAAPAEAAAPSHGQPMSSPASHAVGSQIMQESLASDVANEGDQHSNKNSSSNSQCQPGQVAASAQANTAPATQTVSSAGTATAAAKARTSPVTALGEVLVRQQQQQHLSVAQAGSVARLQPAAAPTAAPAAPVLQQGSQSKHGTCGRPGQAAPAAAADVRVAAGTIADLSKQLLPANPGRSSADTAAAAATPTAVNKQQQGHSVSDAGHSKTAATMSSSRHKRPAEAPPRAVVDAAAVADQGSNAVGQDATGRTVIGKRARTDLREPHVADDSASTFTAAAAAAVAVGGGGGRVAAQNATDGSLDEETTYQFIATGHVTGGAAAVHASGAQQCSAAQCRMATSAGDIPSTAAAAAAAAPATAPVLNPQVAMTLAQPLQQDIKSAAATTAAVAAGSSNSSEAKDNLVKSIDAVLQLELMSDSSPLKNSLALHAVWHFRRQYKKLMHIDPAAALARLEVLHQFVISIKQADLLSLQQVQQRLDSALLCSLPQQGLPSEAALNIQGSTIVLELLLLCWLKDCGITQGLTTETAAGAGPAGGLSHLSLQVLLKAIKLLADTEAATTHTSTLSQLSLQLVEGLSLLLLTSPESVRDPEQCQILQAQWRRSMELCLKLDTLSVILGEVSSQLDDMKS